MSDTSDLRDELPDDLNAAAFVGLISQADDALYLDLFDANGTFIDRSFPLRSLRE